MGIFSYFILKCQCFLRHVTKSKNRTEIMLDIDIGLCSLAVLKEIKGFYQWQSEQL